ncbi:MAG: hypothetical protein JWM78_1497 [Verrucomicrobiaceae bacterium]|nr:hypothetical protein [Verrucomicrobiaceae bacterium]
MSGWFGDRGKGNSYANGLKAEEAGIFNAM